MNLPENPPIPSARPGRQFVGVWLPAGWIAQLDQAAARENSDRSKFIRRALEQKISLRDCFKMTRGAAARDFGCGQGGEAGASPWAGCAGRTNAGHGQKTRRPEGFRANGRLAALLLSRRSMKDILLRRALPSDRLHENSTPCHFKTVSNARYPGFAMQLNTYLFAIAQFTRRSDLLVTGREAAGDPDLTRAERHLVDQAVTERLADLSQRQAAPVRRIAAAVTTL